MVETFSRKVAFVCRRCGEHVGDSLYVGPWGHAPQNVCFTCWVNTFEEFRASWPREVIALWLIANGYTRTEAARKVGVSGRTLRLWQVRLGKDREAFFDMIDSLDDFGQVPHVVRAR
ncbi:MAG TPA: hypothetical protein VMZ50_00665 [Phycisphaerae bacterium]|nr:hypothetical protein [Phycisphaerae bacterium]